MDLGTASTFVVLGGQSVTNTGPSVLHGDLGVAPGTSLVGFGAPALVDGATHVNDAVAAKAQDDLTTAYVVAAGQPVAPADDLTGQDLGNKTLTAGAYRYASSAQLTGQLTLDAEGDPAAQFVFEIGSTLTTASASSVRLVDGASPCNVFWQVGSSATLGSTTAFQGNVMALADISLDSGASVIGRLLARDGSVTLINNLLDGAECTSPPALVSTPATPNAGNPSGSAPAGTAPQSAPDAAIAALPAATTGPRATRRGTATLRRTRRSACTDGFRATVRGTRVKHVTFTLDGRRIRSRSRTPLQVDVPATSGAHTVRARVTFKDGTRARTLTLRYRACSAALRRPRQGPSQFTG